MDNIETQSNDKGSKTLQEQDRDQAEDIHRFGLGDELERFVHLQAGYLMNKVPGLLDPEALRVAREAIHGQVQRGKFDEQWADEPGYATIQAARRVVQERLGISPEVFEQRRRIAAGETTWETYGTDAQYMRVQMAEPFFAWVAQKRSEVERSLFNARFHMAACEPFARAAFDRAESPGKMPVVVVEFAQTALDVMEREAELAKLNAYYQQMATFNYEVDLGIGQASDLLGHITHDLWDWYQREQAEQEEKEEKAQGESGS